MRNDRIMRRADVMDRFVHPDGGPIPTEAEVERKIESALAMRGIAIKHIIGSQKVFVNDSRWAIECDCGAGIACTPGIDHTTCVLCGNRYDVEWPDEEILQRIERTLLERPARLPRDVDARRVIAIRSWVPSQSIDDLEAETERVKELLRDRGRGAG
ncbi:MAG: hypothetical protein C4551_10060 [Bacillota bacterium]|jgi:hypothetical protein|nr:MAG: hypothetical protein C4551_10060 [Bacillota bacterium]